jgi:long-chain acyl-CoA synthetase
MTQNENRPRPSHAAPGVRQNLEYPVIPLYQFLDDAVSSFPDAPAAIFAGSVQTYRELGSQANRLASALRELGVQRGDRVSLMLPNCPQMIAAFYGVLKAGAIVVQVNPLFSSRELENRLYDCGAETIILLDEYLPRLQAIQKRSPVNNVITVNLTGETKAPQEGALDYDLLLAGTGDGAPEHCPDPASDVALIQYTCGTTGISKGAMLTHFNLVANTLQVRETLAATCCRGQDRVLVTLPLFHVYGMTLGMNLALSIAGTQVLLPRFDAGAVLKAINDYRPTYFPGTPYMFTSLLNHPRLADFDLSSLKACISVSAPLSPEVVRRFEALTGGRLVEGYGLTEASPVIAVNSLSGAEKPGSIGRPLPDTECVVVNLDTGEKVLQPGEFGELIVRGSQVMKGYWKHPEETAYALRDGWLFTGDVARMDGDGFIYIVNRKKTAITGVGYDVNPRDVEDVIYEHPGVTEVVVIGIDSLDHEKTIKAYIVLEEGWTVTEEEIIRFCRERLQDYQVPKVVEFRKSLPKTIAGKVLRRVLIEEEKQLLKKQRQR